jgi:capsular exopolysaccharide synthesis family protein
MEALSGRLVDAQLRANRWKTYLQELDKLRDQPGEFRRYAYAYQGVGAASSEDPERLRLETDLYQTEVTLQSMSAVPARFSQVTLLNDRIAQIKDRLAELDKRFVQDHVAWTQARLAESTAEVAFLTGLKRDAAAEAQRIMGEESTYSLLLSEIDILQKQYDSILAQISEIASLVRFEGPQIHVLQDARPATVPSSPQAAHVIGIALALGLMAGAGLSLLRDWTDQRLRSADEITAILGVPILGAVPSMARGRLARSHRLRFAPNSRESEAYRTIRTALLHGTSREHAVTILVTSPGPLEGKTTLVSNLATAMAYAGQRTLIVDADLRKPTQHRVFAANERGLGLADVLAGRASLDEAIRPTEVERLDVLPGGHDVANPSEMLSSPRFAESLDQLTHRYDRILVDSPPVGIVTDAQILATLCDLTLLVLRAEKTSRLLTQRARDALSTVGATVVGAVVNGVRKKDTRYRHLSVNGYPYGNPAPNGSKRTQEELPGEVVSPPKVPAPEAEIAE